MKSIAITNKIRTAFVVILYALAKLPVFAGVFVGLCYGVLAYLFDREFPVFGANQTTLYDVACLVAIFALSSGRQGFAFQHSVATETQSVWDADEVYI